MAKLSSDGPTAFTVPSPIELILLGTGTSSSIPHVDCLTAPPGNTLCRACLSTLTPQGKKNVRRNTSCAFRMNAKDGRSVTIVIDTGKNFQAAAIEWFPKYGLRRIDALLITHAHADAMNGLDDLRGWTLNNSIQSHIDIYLSQETFIEVKRAFPYLVAKEFASGGGDVIQINVREREPCTHLTIKVPEFKWHIISDLVPFEIQDTGIHITPFAVHHGRIFSTVSPIAYLPTSMASNPSTPMITLKQDPSPEQVAPNLNGEAQEPVIHPYICFGFKVEEEIVYISDVSHIPEDKWPILETRPSGKPLPVLVLDCLRLRPHTSHVGLEGAVSIARRVRAKRTYLTGFSHDVAHDEYVTIGKAVGGAKNLNEVELLTETEKSGLAMVEGGASFWLRPAHDGLRVFVESNGSVRDETYLVD